jgi:hypothetical protein
MVALVMLHRITALEAGVMLQQEITLSPVERMLIATRRHDAIPALERPKVLRKIETHRVVALQSAQTINGRRSCA